MPANLGVSDVSCWLNRQENHEWHCVILCASYQEAHDIYFTDGDVNLDHLGNGSDHFSLHRLVALYSDKEPSRLYCLFPEFLLYSMASNTLPTLPSS